VARVTGKYRQIRIDGKPAFAFIPHPLPPSNLPLSLDPKVKETLLPEIERLTNQAALLAQTGLEIDSLNESLICKEAVLSSQIAAVRITLRDVLEFASPGSNKNEKQCQQVLDYIAAYKFAREQITRGGSLHIDRPMLEEVHRRLMIGGDAAEKNLSVGPEGVQLGPPPEDAATELLNALQRWLNSTNDLPPVVRAALAHGQFCLLRPLPGANDRVARILTGLLLEYFKCGGGFFLCSSASFKRRREEYQQRLDAVRMQGDWEGWIVFYLECLRDALQENIAAIQRIAARVNTHRKLLVDHDELTIPTMRLFSKLPKHPYITLALALKLLDATKPTASRAIDLLCRLEILREITGQQRDRVYVYQSYVDILAKDTE